MVYSISVMIEFLFQRFCAFSFFRSDLDIDLYHYYDKWLQLGNSLSRSISMYNSKIQINLSYNYWQKLTFISIFNYIDIDKWTLAWISRQPTNKYSYRSIKILPIKNHARICSWNKPVQIKHMHGCGSNSSLTAQQLINYKYNMLLPLTNAPLVVKYNI